jgi:cytochrome P450
MPVSPLRALQSFHQVAEAFAAPIECVVELPADLRAVAAHVARWDQATRRAWRDHERLSMRQRGVAVGRAIADAIRLQRAIRTHRIDAWLAGAPASSAQAFESWRDAFFARCDALAALATEALVVSDLAMPEDGVRAMALRNPARLGQLLGGRAPFGTAVSVYLATAAVALREREFFGGFVARQLRRSGVPLSAARARRTMTRLNARAGRTLITHRHVEPLLAAYAALGDRGVRTDAADAFVLAAMEAAETASGKPWKGLVRLYDLLVYSGVNPRAPEWPAAFEAAMTGPVDYTHVPGREWIVREYTIGKRLMQIDGKIAPGDRWAGLQQGRSSLATGYLRGGQNRTEFGRRYSKPLAAFLDSMVVAEGPDHQRLRKAFLPFFSQAAVLAHAGFVEATVAELLDDASRVARANAGLFDLRTDFAYHFPIRIICRMLELPAADVPQVQHWSEAAVRAMDTEAGVSFHTALAGQQASDQLRSYLGRKLAEARAGTFDGHVINAIARDETLSENERIANLGVVIFAGFETTTGLLAKGVDALLRHPAQWAHLRDSLVPGEPVAVGDAVVPDREWRWLAWALDQPDRAVDVARRDRLSAMCASSARAANRFEAIRAQERMLEQAIEELLRWTAPGTVVPLTASKDVSMPLESAVTIKGCPHAAGSALAIRRGETVAVAVDELNRRCPVGAGQFDTAADPSRLDVSRADNTAHLSFGLRHSCIGAFLAKENAKRALEGILRRFPDLESAGDPIPQEMELFSGLAHLPVRSRGAAR